VITVGEAVQLILKQFRSLPFEDAAILDARRRILLKMFAPRAVSRRSTIQPWK
jgi:hypothetical protein